MGRSHNGGYQSFGMGRLWGASALVLAACLANAPAQAEGKSSSVNEGAVQQVDEVVVTGTRIRHTDAVSANPITVVGAQALQVSNVQTIADVLSKLPVISHQGYGGATPAGQQTGTTGVDMRNLGPSRALVLVDGRRYTPSISLLNIAVNVDTIPVSMIDRIEILRDGASPIYGSDAVAGVINIITKQHFNGAQIDADTGVSGRGDGATYHVSVTVGREFSAGNILANLSYVKKDGLTAQQRAYSANPVQGYIPKGSGGFTPYFGSIFSPGGTWLSQGVTFIGPTTSQYALLPETGYVETNNSSIVDPMETYAGTVHARYELSPQIKAFFDADYARDDTVSYGSAAEFFAGRSAKYPSAGNVPADNPYNLIGIPITNFYKSFDTVGDRYIPTRTTTWEAAVGLRGEFGDGYEWTASYKYGSSNSRSGFPNNLNVNHLVTAYDPILCAAAPTCAAAGAALDPFGPATITPAFANYIRQNDTVTNRYVQQIGGLSLTGRLAKLPAGPLSFALGGEIRRESGGTSYDDIILAGDSSLIDAKNTSGAYTSKEVYAELNAPLLKDVALAKSLTVDGAVRYSDYDLFGGSTTWKIGLNWAVNDDVRVRGGVGTAFRAPSIIDLYGGALNTFSTYADPCDPTKGRRSNPSVDAACLAQGLGSDFRQVNSKTLGLRTGSANLVPETADEANIGVVFTPRFAQGLAVAIDYFSIKLKNAISQPGTGIILSECYSNYSASNSACAGISRNAAGQISEILLPKENFGGVRTDGVDFSVQYAFEASRLGLGVGQFTASLDGAYLLNYKQQALTGGPFTQLRGYFAQDGSFGSYNVLRATGNLTYSRGDWRLDYKIRYIEGGKAFGFMPEAEPMSAARTPDVYYNDISLSYRRERYQITVGIENIADTQPPFIFGTQYDATAYDLMGQYFYLKFSAKY